MKTWYQRSQTREAQQAITEDQAMEFAQTSIHSSLTATVLPQFVNGIGNQIYTAVNNYAQQIAGYNSQFGLDTNEVETENLLYEILKETTNAVASTRSGNVMNVVTNSPRLPDLIRRWEQYHSPSAEEATELKIRMTQETGGQTQGPAYYR